MSGDDRIDRRGVLASAGAALAAAVAGCGGGTGGQTTTTTAGGTTATGTTTTTTETTTTGTTTETTTTTGNETTGTGTTTTGTSGGQSALSSPIKLGGRVTAWIGMSPSRIDGEENPTLTLQAGTQYELTWENLDGVEHEFIIETGSGEDLVKSESLEQKGATTTVTFTADESMAEYYCEYHPTSMRGTVEVV